MDFADNFIVATVSTIYTNTDTSIVLNSGHGFSDPSVVGEYNVVWYNSTQYPNVYDDLNKEIIRIIALSGNTITILRGQENTTASNKNISGVNYFMILAPTAKILSDITVDIATHTNDNNAHHTEIHTIESHNTTVTGSELDTDHIKLSGIDVGAEANNISDVNAIDLTDGGETVLHSHAGGSSVVDSVFGRIGAIVATQNDYTHTQLNSINANDHHNETHTIVSHDTDATGIELNSLTDGSNADSLHSHSGSGAGDMTMAVYDPNGNGIVNNSEALQDGVGTKTYSDISTEIDSDISTHAGNSDAHHTEIHPLVSHDTVVTGAQLDADHIKLQNIENNATDDQTKSEIEILGIRHSSTSNRTANDHHSELHDINSHPDTIVTGTQLNVDHAKLGGIEAGAEANNITDIDAIDLTDGNETTLHTHAGSGSGDVATDDIWDNKGDLATATANNIASVLPVGSNGQILLADSAEITGIKWGNLGGGGDMLKSVYDSDDNGIVDLTLEQARLQGNVLTGPIVFNPNANIAVIDITGNDNDLTWMLGHTGDGYGFYWRYHGTGDGDANYLTINSENGTDADFYHFRYHQTTHVVDCDSDLVMQNDHTVDGRDVSVDGIKLDTIETNAEVNNISDVNATSLTDGSEITLHSHVGGSGDVSKVGIPINNQIGVWTGDGTIEGETGLIFDGITLDTDGTLTIDSINEHTIDAGVAIEGLDIKNSLLKNVGNDIYNNVIDSNSTLTINKSGYNDGISYFRDFEIYDGKDNLMIHVEPVTDNITFYGSIKTDNIVQGPSTIGVYIENTRFNSGGNITTPGIIRTNTINEYDTDDGVTVDGILIKDGLVDGLDCSSVSAGADITGDNPPQAHDASHANGGSDELNVTGLSGLLADSQTPLTHDLNSHGSCTLAELSTDISDAILASIAGVETFTNKIIELDDALGTNQTYEGTIINGTVGEAVVFGNLLFMNTDGRWWKTSSAVSNGFGFPVKAMAVEPLSTNSSGKLLLNGIVRNDTWNFTTFGKLYCGVDVPTHTQPTTSGHTVQIVGISLDADRMYFNPDNTYLELA